MNRCTNSSHRTFATYHSVTRFTGSSVGDRAAADTVDRRSTTVVRTTDDQCELVHGGGPARPRTPEFPESEFPNSAPRALSFVGVTEIPEHLLKRSQARRGAGGDAAAATPATTPATTTPAAAPAPVPAAAPAAPVVVPDAPVVAAYKARKKIPVWAMVTLSILPVWAFLYVRALVPEEVEASGPIAMGTELYANCASCHGAGGQGIGSAYAFVNGSVLATFPHIEDQLRWVKLGSAAYLAAGVQIPGDPNREGGPHITGASGGVMPAAGAGLGLTDYEILATICHVRYDLGGADAAGEYAEEFEKWCSPESEIFLALESGSATFDDLHEQFEDVMDIGSVPVAGTGKS